MSLDAGLAIKRRDWRTVCSLTDSLLERCLELNLTVFINEKFVSVGGSGVWKAQLEESDPLSLFKRS